MTIKEYLQDKTLISLQIAAGILLGITTDTEARQTTSDTSTLQMGTPVVDITEFTVEEDTITCSEGTFSTVELGVSMPENDNLV